MTIGPIQLPIFPRRRKRCPRCGLYHRPGEKSCPHCASLSDNEVAALQAKHEAEQAGNRLIGTVQLVLALLTLGAILAFLLLR